jgi:pimeloyl-ACP methyl ester carboxylesterase
MPIVEANGTRLHYVVDDLTPPWADAPETLYIQHGAGRTLNFWTHWVPAFADRYRVLRRDLRGHGDSEIPEPGHPYTLDELVDDTIGFLDALGIERVHYVGESVGGIAGIVCAARHPERFASLTVCGVVPAVDAEEARALAHGHEDAFSALERGGTERWVRDDLIPAGIISGGATAEHRAWVVQEYSRTPTHVLQGMTSRIGGLDLFPFLERLAVPTLLMASTRSPMAPLERQVAAWRALPQGRLAVIDGPTHEIYVDRPDECIAALAGFLTELDDDR